MQERRPLWSDFELRGTFWLPDRADVKVGGRLVCHAGRAELELVGSFHGIHAADEVSQVPLIVGVTNEGPCTLREAIRTNLTSKFGGAAHVTESTWAPSHFFVGEAFESLDDIEFEAADLEFDELEPWLGRPAFDVKFEDGGIATARHSFPPEVSVKLPEHEATMRIERTFASGGDTFRALRWESPAVIAFEVDEARPFQWFMNRLGDARTLLGLLVGEAVTPTRVSLRPPGTGTTTSVEAIFSVNGQPADRRLHPAEMLMPYPHIEERFPVIVQRWFERQSVLRNTVALLFGTLYAPDLPSEFRFLALTQALETLHRRVASGFYLPEEEYARVEDALVAAIPPEVVSDQRQSLKNRIKYGNEFSQNRRFLDLLKRLDPVARRAVAPDPPAFIRKVVDQRNYLTHYPAGDSPPMGATEMFYASVRLRGFLTLLLLQQIGVEGQEAVDGVSRTRWHRGFLG